MRAAFYQGARTFTTDLHIFQGHLNHRVPKGGIIGHETFGEIVEAPQASGFKGGDRVVVPSG